MALLAVLAVLGGAGALLVRALENGPGARWLDRMRENPRRLVEPGPLVAAHRAVPECQDCYACHELTADVPSAKCEKCHEEIAERRAAGVGHHGRDLTGECAGCHADHGAAIIDFDRTAFNHRRAAFVLEGRHAALECEKCHTVAGDFRFIGIAHQRCVDCHEDPHRGTLTAAGRDCLCCHDQVQWGGRHLAFRHDRDSDFPLQGAHRTVACTACHPPPAGSATLGEALFSGLGTSCVDCHADPHAGQFAGEGCAACHRETGFTGSELRFSHATFAPFLLEGAHARVECLGCHQNPSNPDVPLWRGVSKDCVACHRDPHAGQFGAAGCASCHGVNGFAGKALRFDHATFEPFPLSGAHSGVACVGCHQPAGDAGVIRYRGVAHDCAACHADPHAGSLSEADCAVCHATGAWRGPSVTFDHDRDTRFPIDATHRSLDCAACHRTLAFRPAPTSCAGCHPLEAGYMEGIVPVGDRVEVWPPDPHAGRVGCQDCHDTSVAHQASESYARRCAGCHSPRYATLFVGRGARLAELATRAHDARLEAYLRVGAHGYVEAERRASRLMGATKDD